MPCGLVVDQLAMFALPGKELLVTFCLDWIDDELIARVERGEALWCAADVWRAVGWRSERRGVADQAERFYLRALDTSRQQGAIAWELRAVASLAAMWAAMNRLQEALDILDETLANRVSGELGGADATMLELHWVITEKMANIRKTS